MLFRYQDLALPNLLSKMITWSEEEIDMYTLVKRIWGTLASSQHRRDLAWPNLMSKMLKWSEEEIDLYTLVKRIWGTIASSQHRRDLAWPNLMSKMLKWSEESYRMICSSTKMPSRGARQQHLEWRQWSKDLATPTTTTRLMMYGTLRVCIPSTSDQSGWICT